MTESFKTLKSMQRVKVLSAPNEPPHPLNHNIGVVQGVHTTRKNVAGVVIYKSYSVQFGNSSNREVEAKYLWPVGGE